jgi:hypothetical protein
MDGMEYFYELSSGLACGGHRDNKSTQILLLYPYFKLKHGKKMIAEYNPNRECEDSLGA